MRRSSKGCRRRAATLTLTPTPTPTPTPTLTPTPTRNPTLTLTLTLTLQVDEASGAAKDPAGFERRLLRVLSSLEEGARGQVDSK